MFDTLNDLKLRSYQLQYLRSYQTLRYKVHRRHPRLFKRLKNYIFIFKLGFRNVNEYLTYQTILNEKFINYKVLDLPKLYNLNIRLFSS